MKIAEKLKPKLRVVFAINRRLLLRLVAAIVGAAIVIFAQPLVATTARAVVGQAALFSAAITMPRSALQSLRERFAGDTADDDVLPLAPPAPPAPAEPPVPPATPPPVSAAPPAPPAPASPQGKPPDIPAEHRAPLVTMAMAGESGNPAFLQQDTLWLRNYTKLSLDKIAAVLEQDCGLELGSADAPQVLIYHTHTTESYEQYDNTVYDLRNSWRDTDNNNNMAAVGTVLAQELEQRGISVIHDTAQHDHPSYNGAYDRSRKTVKDYLADYPSIKVTIDLHRDGIIQADNTVVKPTIDVSGRRAAQLMLIAPCDDGSVGVPGWRENLRFAAELQRSIESSVPGLCRPIFFCYRNYNLGLTDASLLFELGTNGNTLDEALYTAKLLAEPIAKVLNRHTSPT